MYTSGIKNAQQLFNDGYINNYGRRSYTQWGNSYIPVKKSADEMARLKTFDNNINNLNEYTNKMLNGKGQSQKSTFDNNIKNLNKIGKVEHERAQKIIEKYGEDNYKDAQSNLKSIDKAFGNGDGRLTMEEYDKYLSGAYKNLFGNDQVKLDKAAEIAKKQNEIMTKYAGEDGILSTAEYMEALNSKEYIELVDKSSEQLYGANK